MLTMTTEARAAVESIVANANAADTGGVRIAEDGTGANGFALSVTPEPQQDDTVVAEAGARIFLDETAAVALDDKVLDAAPDAEGAVRFALLQQP
ncbi:Fe-S cluster assembly protein HesB [Microbacterium invictum]|uniref:Fe-S cluster assembly iron-binding protein IscA n=1 Tax=Microbacterium invictum TaxID=515415 RepID=A0AA40VM30_9MICO|nr:MULTISPECIES: Fe-S cluster assembly protein HesB [Microbacterium]MBB4139981.1 Fe-S cluster assembly iron-binding protein IscA [Microbacterium invictum]